MTVIIRLEPFCVVCMDGCFGMNESNAVQSMNIYSGLAIE